MKVGIRKPSVKKSIKARTTGKVKRAVKKSVNPLYGKRGVGFIKDPERSVKNAVYHRTTVGVGDIVKGATSTGTSAGAHSSQPQHATVPAPAPAWQNTALMIICIILIIMGLLLAVASPITGIVTLIMGIAGVVYARKKKKEGKSS